MFTGDRSGEWLFRALHRSGFANQAECSSADDGLTLDGCLITAICHCAPPDNKPTPQEIDNCSPFLIESIDETPWRVLVCLGGMSWNRVGRIIGAPRLPKFGHGVESLRSDGRIVIASYHPSQQNTFTGKLTEPMLDAIFQRARGLL
jgi:uracil-DNA glycosylase family 4